MANSSAFRTATKGIGEATRPAFKDVLVDMIGTCPRKTTSVVATDHVQWRIVGGAALGEDHGHQVLLLGLHVVGVVLGHFLSGLEESHSSRIRSEGEMKISSNNWGSFKLVLRD